MNDEGRFWSMTISLAILITIGAAWLVNEARLEERAQRVRRDCKPAGETVDSWGRHGLWHSTRRLYTCPGGRIEGL